MTSSSDVPAGRGLAPDADGQTTGRPSRRRRAAPAATALSLLDSCGLAPSPAQAGSASGSHAPAPQPVPARGRRSARERTAALAAEADRLAAAYGLSEGGEGLVVLPGDDEDVWTTGPATSVTESLPGGQGRPPRAGESAPPHEAVTASRAQGGDAPLPQGVEVAARPGAQERVPTPADKADRASGPDAADKTGRGPVAVVASAVPLAGPETGSIAPQAEKAAPAHGRRAFAQDGMEDARATVRDARGRSDPGLGDVPVMSGGPAGMGRREAAFRQWAADMQARFEAGLEAGERDAGQASMVVLPPPLESAAGPCGKGREKGGRSRRGQDGSAAGAARESGQGPRPRAWKTRRRSTEPGHEARFGDWHGPARTGTILERVFISLGAAPEQAKLNRLWREWAAVLGPDLAPLARPLGHHGDRLLIGAEDALLLQELYYMGPEIVRRVNAFLREDFFTAVKVSLMLDHQDLDAPGPVAARAAAPAPEPLPAPSGASLGLMDPESAVARCYARFLGLELPDPRR